MNLEREFIQWLSTSKRKRNGEFLSKSSAYKYARAIDSVSADMMSSNVIDTHLYSITSPSELKTLIYKIRDSHDFCLKNETGHNMYSVALEHYLEFISERY